MIDHIELHGILALALSSAGQLPPGIGFDSNQKAMCADMALDETLGHIPGKQVNTSPCRLSTGNERNSIRYLEKLKELLLSQNSIQ